MGSLIDCLNCTVHQILEDLHHFQIHLLHKLPNYLKNGIQIQILFLLQTDYLKNFIWAASELFIDFKIPLEWLRCHSLGVNLLTLEALNCGNRTVSQFNYGYIFLSLPYNEFLDVFYRFLIKGIF